MIWRLLPALLPQLVALALTWNFSIAGLGQGAHYVTSGWWGTLLGLVVLAMGLIPLIAGGVVGLLVALFFRVPAQPRVKDDDFAGVMLGGGLLYAAAYLVVGSLMWQFAPPSPGPNATYGTSFVFAAALVALGVGLATSALVTAIITRRGLPTT